MVTPGELESAIARATAETPSEIVVHDVLRVFDADGDGRITPQEAEAAVHHAGAHPGDATAAGLWTFAGGELSLDDHRPGSCTARAA